MAKQRYINTEFWDDEYILSLPTAGKLLFIYLFTNARATVAGVYKTTISHITFHTGMTAIEVDSWMQKFAADGKAVYRDGWLVMINTIRHQNTANVKIRSGIEEILKTCPQWIKDIVSDRSYMTHQETSHLNLNSNLNLNSKNGVPPVAAVAAADNETDPWAAGIKLLAKAKMTEAQARPFLGRLAQQYTAADLHTAIAVTSEQKPADAKAFLIGVLKKRAKDKARIYVGRNDASDDGCTVCRNIRWVDPEPDVLAAGFASIACPACRPDDHAFVLQKCRSPEAAAV